MDIKQMLTDGYGWIYAGELEFINDHYYAYITRHENNDGSIWFYCKNKTGNVKRIVNERYVIIIDFK
jgi:hypothetical protein